MAPRAPNDSSSEDDADLDPVFLRRLLQIRAQHAARVARLAPRRQQHSHHAQSRPHRNPTHHQPHQGPASVGFHHSAPTPAYNPAQGPPLAAFAGLLANGPPTGHGFNGLPGYNPLQIAMLSGAGHPSQCRRCRDVQLPELCAIHSQIRDQYNHARGVMQPPNAPQLLAHPHQPAPARQPAQAHAGQLSRRIHPATEPIDLETSEEEDEGDDEDEEEEEE